MKRLENQYLFFEAKKLVGVGIFLFIDFALEASFEVSLSLIDFVKSTCGLCTEL